MNRLETIRAQSTLSDIFEGQAQHLGILFFMICGCRWLLDGYPDTGHFLWLGSRDWAFLSIWLAVTHQIVVAAGFRLQLHRAVLTRIFRRNDIRAWGIVFFPLLIARPLTILTVGILDMGSLGVWRPGELALGAVLLTIAAYTMVSVVRYFSFPRALGGDHFRDAYAEMPMVTEGAFRWTGNAMYVLGFLGLWGIALLCGSIQALIVAGFQHAYIWVHMYTVEGPDMRHIYGPPLKRRHQPTRQARTGKRSAQDVR